MSQETVKILQRWGEDVVKDMVAFLDTIGKTNTGQLAKSLRWEVREDGENLIMELKSAPYGEYVRLGVQGAGPFTKPNKAPNSPFKFGTGTGRPGGLRASIDKWVITKGLPGIRDKKGRFIPRKSMVFLISRSIYRFGIRPTNFVFPFFQRQDELTALIGQATANQVIKQIKEAF